MRRRLTQSTVKGVQATWLHRLQRIAAVTVAAAPTVTRFGRTYMRAKHADVWLDPFHLVAQHLRTRPLRLIVSRRLVDHD